MTCSDCARYDLCKYNTYQQARYFGKDEEIYITIDNNTTCKFFKDKSNFVEVKHGEWNLEVRSFYMDTWDESPELCVYILASCSNCGKEHSPKKVFSMNIYAPEDADFDYRFDREYEETKALEKFKQHNYEFQNFCSHCGADMRKGGADNGEIH